MQTLVNFVLTEIGDELYEPDVLKGTQNPSEFSKWRQVEILCGITVATCDYKDIWCSLST